MQLSLSDSSFSKTTLRSVLFHANRNNFHFLPPTAPPVKQRSVLSYLSLTMTVSSSSTCNSSTSKTTLSSVLSRVNHDSFVFLPPTAPPVKQRSILSYLSLTMTVSSSSTCNSSTSKTTLSSVLSRVNDDSFLFLPPTAPPVKQRSVLSYLALTMIVFSSSHPQPH